ncbi:MAG: exodeoxyribonuclease VII small subunit [Acidobacteria bacterium]|nr:exodeoxyribonuclease VII small subunit [Acidobacteriota bacterium]
MVNLPELEDGEDVVEWLAQLSDSVDAHSMLTELIEKAEPVSLQNLKPDETTDDEPIAYTDALDELDEILTELDADDVDVDLVARRVERAAELLTLCRSRLSDAQVQVDRVVADLDRMIGDDER